MTRPAKRRGVKREAPMVLVGPVQLGIKLDGRDGASFGDEVMELSVQGTRFDVANDLRLLARVIAQTEGRKVQSAQIAVLLRFETTKPPAPPKRAAGRRKRNV